jgi:hypothetical protein
MASSDADEDKSKCKDSMEIDEANPEEEQRPKDSEYMAAFSATVLQH